MFPAITLYTRLSLILSWAAAGIFAFAGLGAFAAHIANGTAFVGFLSLIALWIIGFFVWLWIRILPEVLTILLKIEENTRRPS